MGPPSLMHRLHGQRKIVSRLISAAAVSENRASIRPLGMYQRALAAGRSSLTGSTSLFSVYLSAISQGGGISVGKLSIVLYAGSRQ